MYVGSSFFASTYSRWDSFLFGVHIASPSLPVALFTISPIYGAARRTASSEPSSNQTIETSAVRHISAPEISIQDQRKPNPQKILVQNALFTHPANITPIDLEVLSEGHFSC